MPEFDVLITETLTKTVTVEAENKDKAFWRVCQGWKDGEYILDAENFCDIEFEIKANGTVTRYDVKGNIRRL